MITPETALVITFIFGLLSGDVFLAITCMAIIAAFAPKWKTEEPDVDIKPDCEMEDLNCDYIEFRVSGISTIYEGEAAQKYYQWLLDVLEADEVSGIADARPAPSRVVALPDAGEWTINEAGEKVPINRK